MVVDDDVVYPRDFLSNLLSAHRQRPDAALGYRGVDVALDVSFVELPHVFATGVPTHQPVDVLFGTWGYLVPAGALTDAVHDFSACPDVVRNVDDIWISGHLAQCGVARLVVSATTFPIETTAIFRGTLTGGVNSSGVNDRIAVQFFEGCWGRPGRPEEGRC